MAQKEELTARQAAFVREYLIDGNATQAAIRAGYNPTTARMQGPRLMTYDAVKLAILRAQQQLHESVRKSTSVSKSRLVEMAMRGAEGAEEDREWSAYRSNLDLASRLLGYIVDHKSVRIVRGAEDLADEELAAIEAQADAERARRPH